MSTDTTNMCFGRAPTTHRTAGSMTVPTPLAENRARDGNTGRRSSRGLAAERTEAKSPQAALRSEYEISAESVI